MTDNDAGAPLPPIDEGAAATPVPTSEGAPSEAHSTAADPAPAAAASGKPDVGKRVLAYIIDWVVAMILYAILAPVSAGFGALVGAAYLLLRDGFDFEFMRGRSLGKRMMKLTVQRDDGGKMDFMTSVKRNWPLAISMLPIGLLSLVIAPIALVIGLYEVYLALTSSDGRRWGDKMAGTRLVEVAD